MPRRAKVDKRIVIADAKYNNKNITRFIGKLMMDGKRSLAERIVYDSLDLIEQRQKRNPIDVFELALRNATPTLEVKPRRVGGSTYQVPVEVGPNRRTSLSIRWILTYSRARGEKSMEEKLAAELIDAANNRGNSIKKKEDTHRMAEANKAFAHYRW